MLVRIREASGHVYGLPDYTHPSKLEKRFVSASISKRSEMKSKCVANA
jgi:hypothetical protein